MLVATRPGRCRRCGSPSAPSGRCATAPRVRPDRLGHDRSAPSTCCWLCCGDRECLAAATLGERGVEVETAPAAGRGDHRSPARSTAGPGRPTCWPPSDLPTTKPFTRRARPGRRGRRWSWSRTGSAPSTCCWGWPGRATASPPRSSRTSAPASSSSGRPCLGVLGRGRPRAAPRRPGAAALGAAGRGPAGPGPPAGQRAPAAVGRHCWSCCRWRSGRTGSTCATRSSTPPRSRRATCRGRRSSAAARCRTGPAPSTPTGHTSSPAFGMVRVQPAHLRAGPAAGHRAARAAVRAAVDPHRPGRPAAGRQHRRPLEAPPP